MPVTGFLVLAVPSGHVHEDSHFRVPSKGLHKIVYWIIQGYMQLGHNRESNEKEKENMKLTLSIVSEVSAFMFMYQESNCKYNSTRALVELWSSTPQNPALIHPAPSLHPGTLTLNPGPRDECFKRWAIVSFALLLLTSGLGLTIRWAISKARTKV